MERTGRKCRALSAVRAAPPFNKTSGFTEMDASNWNLSKCSASLGSMTRLATCVGLLFSVSLFASCDNLTLSKEQRQVNDAIRLAIAADPSRINKPYADGAPPLHMALEHHIPALFDWLLDHGADPNVQDQRGQTALHKAVFDSPDHKPMRALLKRGANVNAKDGYGYTPLHSAALSSRPSAVEVLLAAGADPNARDQWDKTPLHYASGPQPFAIPENVVRTIHLLVAAGADLQAQGKCNPPLHTAAVIGSTLAVQTLLSQGAQVDARGMGGRTALHVAAVFAKPEVAEILLKAGADPNRRDDRGFTPLGLAMHYPAFTSNAERTGPVDTRAVVEVLRRFGATNQDAPPVVKDSAVSLEEFYRRLDSSERVSGADTKEVSEAVAFLDNYLRNPERYGPGPGAIEQARAALVLFRIKPDSEIAKSKLAELMDFVRESDDSVPDYLGIARGLKKLGAKAEPLYPALLLDALTDREAENRRIAIDALASILPSRQNLIANLKRIQVNDWDIEALIGNISPSDYELRSELALALRHPYPSIRERAISVVGVIRSPDKTMLSELESLKRDADPHVRKSAVKTWERVHNTK